MIKSSQLIWLGIFLFLLLPSATGRFFLDIAGGLLILLAIIPILITIIGWISWKIFQSQLSTCTSCGTSFFSQTEQCPICGSLNPNLDLNKKNNSVPASAATIDVSAEEAQ